MRQMEAKGVSFRTNVFIDKEALPAFIANTAKETITPDELKEQFDAVVIAGGSETPRDDLPVLGRELEGIYYAMEFLPQQNKVNAGDKLTDQLLAKGKYVVVIGGGDTGSDCVGTSNRHGAKDVMQFELLAQPPEVENKPLVWPYWPLKLRTSSSHEEGLRSRLVGRDEALRRQERQGRKADRGARRVEGRQDAGSTELKIRTEGRSRAAGDGLHAAGVAGAKRSASRRMRAAMCVHRPKATRRITRRWTRCSRRAICGVGSRWWCGRFEKGVSARGRWMRF